VKILAIDIGGSHVKALLSGETEYRKADSGPDMTPEKMIEAVRQLTEDWSWDRIAIGFPAAVKQDRIVTDPVNLGPGWVGFDFEAAFGCPVRMMNDAAMQALGSWQGSKMLFLGLGTGLGSAMVADGVVLPMELAHLPYRVRGTYEDYLGERGRDRMGDNKWRKHVWRVVRLFRAALQPDEVVIGGGNARRLTDAPEGVRLGANANAFIGAFRLWQSPQSRSKG
jgi:predicted NBD/HSP70 family sugar kinase